MRMIGTFATTTTTTTNDNTNNNSNKTNSNSNSKSNNNNNYYYHYAPRASWSGRPDGAPAGGAFTLCHAIYVCILRMLIIYKRVCI